MSSTLSVGGLQRFTTIDFPGRISAVVFCRGCTWACRYCHNAEIQDFHRRPGDIAWNDVTDFLRKRRGLLDAVVFSGGEPTAQAGLPLAIQECRELGYAVGLHTAGIYPERLAQVLSLVDWVGFDLKAPLDERYDRVTLVKNSAEAVRRSLAHLQTSGVECQLRTTYHPRLLSKRDLNEIRAEARSRGLPEPVVQNFRPQGCADTLLTSEPES